MSSIKIWKIIWSLLITCSMHNVLYSYEFLYPVAVLERQGQTKVYVIYQKSVTHLELWVWNPETKIASKGLMSTYIPASLRVLPSKDGFSFIDEGRIRIKKFKKRSPRAIDIYEPIYEMNQVEWIDEHNLYVSARKNNYFCIFQISDTGLIHCLVQDDIHDCVYPQKAGDTLFYIERCLKEGEYKKEHVSYKLVATEYSVVNGNDSQKDLTNLEYEAFEAHVNKLLSKRKSKSEQKKIEKNYIADFKSSPIAFLQMFSEDEGFFLEHCEEIDRHDKYITFSCYHVKKWEENWNCTNIFDFSIPACLILDLLDFRLYESMLPLIPKYHNGCLYYVDMSPSKSENLNLFCYNIENEMTEQKSFGRSGQIFFSPLFTKNKIFYGGSVESSESRGQRGPNMWINDEGLVCIDLPTIYYR